MKPTPISPVITSGVACLDVISNTTANAPIAHIARAPGNTYRPRVPWRTRYTVSDRM